VSKDEIIVNNAKEHNLKSVSIKIPKNALTVVTGPSGSGKSSLAFDTIYVEGQRRYIESLSSYARQFLGQYQPPDVESISGLSPAVAIDQKNISRNPRSTVGTTTEIYDYLRVLYARIGTLYDPETNEEIKKYSRAQIVKEVLKYENKTKINLLSPINVKSQQELDSSIKNFLASGFARARINGETILFDDLEKVKIKDIKEFCAVVDRIIVKDNIRQRVADSVELALKYGSGTIILSINDEDKAFSEHYNVSSFNTEIPELEPRLFSFNSPVGACEKCKGLGLSKDFDKDLMIKDPTLSISEGALAPLSKRNRFFYKMVKCIVEHENVSMETPLNKLPKKFLDILFNGSRKVYLYSFISENSHFEFSKAFPGLIRWLEKKYRETTSDKLKLELEQFMDIAKCSDCNGMRLNPIALSTKIKNHNIMDVSNMSIMECSNFFNKISLKGEKAKIADKLLTEIKNRLNFLLNVGLDYLGLNRSSGTLSGGEAQRIRLATQIGSALTGVLYVLDEPSIGLHQRDNFKLIKTLKKLRDIGNTVLVVEHDEETMMNADYIIDMGPGAGIHGGEVIAKGTIQQILKSRKSLTGKYLNQSIQIPTPTKRRESQSSIQLKHGRCNNIEDINVEIPLDSLVGITGVSGSGKSTLIHEILIPAVRNHLEKSEFHLTNYNYESISGLEEITNIIELDQGPIGRTPQSNPATYTNIFDNIRTLYSQTNESKIRNYKPGRFSFNVRGGRCDECEGNGVKKIEMHFLADVYITCDECKGTRYNSETLSILYKGLNIADVLNLSIEEGRDFFKNHGKINRVLTTLCDVGLGYMKLGQPATTLSGGEAQRMKLCRELAKRVKGKTLYVLDEPTTGLHFKDISILIKALNQLVESGHSVVIIEHNLDVIKSCDYLVDLGPEGGDKGGTVVTAGTPEEVAKNKKSYTGKFLKKCLKK
jgi:excinuclease ABC subunit A